MANKHRGEVDISIAGKTYAVSLTLDAMAHIAGNLGVETLGELEGRVVGLKLADFKPILKGLLVGNGFSVPDRDLNAMHFREYTETIMAVWNAKPVADDDEADASPRKRAT